MRFQQLTRIAELFWQHSVIINFEGAPKRVAQVLAPLSGRNNDADLLDANFINRAQNCGDLRHFAQIC
ncbi:MAG: hypothetical protein ACI9PY_001766 [Ascidiaceihabitans sp.]|jgi:hypothetical protein